MTDPATTNSGPAAEPADDAQAAAAVAAEASEGGAHLTRLAELAKEKRGEDYDGKLTPELLIALEELLRQPTPAKYVKHIPRTEGKPYASTGLNSTQFQTDVMNAVLGRPHWRVLRHYPPDKNGFLCKVAIVVGNNLQAASLDERGELVVGEADVIAVEEEWGSVKNATAPGDAYKGSATNAMKRAIASFGPGADVYRQEFDDENVGGVGDLHARADASGAGGAPPGGGQPKVANGRQQNMLRAKARDAGLDDAQLANTILWAAGHPAVQFGSLQQATNYVAQLLAALPVQLVDTLKQALDNMIAQRAAATQAAAAAATAQGVERVGGSAIPGDLAALAPVPASVNGHGAGHPPAQAA
jgi:hypothetical protein